MFAKLKKKIQEEAQAVVGPSEDKKAQGRVTSPGPGLASPVNKDYPVEESSPNPSRGPFFGHVRRDSSEMSLTPTSSKMGSRASSVDDIAKESSGSKEEVLTMLMRRTEQVKKLEAKISELAAMIKEKNKNIDKLESNLEKQQEAAEERVAEITDKYNTEKSKFTERFDATVSRKEEEIRINVQKEMEELEKSKTDLQSKLQEAHGYRKRYLKQEEENDEFLGLTSQELAKVKHMLLITQDELKDRDNTITISTKKIADLDNEIQSLMEQIGVITSTSETSEETNKALTMKFDEFQHAVELAENNLSKKDTELCNLTKKHNELLTTQQALQRDATLEKQQLQRDIESKTEELSHQEERVKTLELRLQGGDLSADERVKAFETERDSLEKRITELREQLAKTKTSSSQNVSKLEHDISDLKQQLKEKSVDCEKSKKDALDNKNNLQKEIDSWKSRLHMALLEVKEKDRLLGTLKQNQEAELLKYQIKSSQVEEGLRDQLRHLKSQVDSVERARDRERHSAQEKIAKLESGQEDWLEREIDSERQITRLEEDLQKTKVEVSEKDKQILGLKKEVIIKQKELQELETKKQKQEENMKQFQQNSNNFENSLGSLQQELNSTTNEKDDLLLRNAQLSQEYESHKRRTTQEISGLQKEVTRRDAAVSGLEQSLHDLQQESQLHQQKAKDLECQREAALDKVESDEINRLKKQSVEYEDQLSEKNKTIKLLQQRLTELKKTLQRELKVQSLPNDDPSDRLASTNSKDLSHSPQPDTANGLYSSHASSDPSSSKKKHDISSPPSLAVSQWPHRHSDTQNSHTAAPHNPNMAYMRPYPPDVHKIPGLPNFSIDGMTMSQNFTTSYRGSKRQHGGNMPLSALDEVNFEYLKHVILKFMLSKEHEAIHLIKAVSMLLHFTPDEQRLISDTLEWKMSWFGTRPSLGKGQLAKVIGT